MATTATMDATREAAGARAATATLAVAGAATLLVMVDFTTALTTPHDTARALGASTAWQTWALSAMSLGLAAALLTAGALADDLGRRRTLRAGLLGLAVATLVAAVAPSIEVFVAGRALQGVAGAAVVAAALGLIGHAFPSGVARTRATGVWGATVGGGIAAGPLLSGALTEASGWRAVYWLGAALALALQAAAERLEESRAPVRRALDLPGAVTLTASMAALTGAFVSARQGWTSPTTLALLAGGAVVLAAFAVVEHRRAEPMLDLALLRRPAFVVSVCSGLAMGVSLIALMSYLPAFLQRAMGLSVLASGAVIAAWSATSTVVAWHARRIPERIGTPQRLAIGFALCAVGLVGLASLPAGADWPRLVPGLVIAGLGTGVVNASLGRIAVASVPAHRTGLGSGANNTARYLGGSVGIALVVTVATAGGGDRAALVHGWNRAALLTAALSAVGALLALAPGRRGAAS